MSATPGFPIVRAGKTLVCAVLAAVALALAALPAALRAAPAGGDGGPQDPGPSPAAVRDCVAGASATLTPDAGEIPLGGGTTIRWSATLPAACDEISATLDLAGRAVGTSGELPVTPMSTSGWVLRLMLRGGAAKDLARAEVAVKLPQVVDIRDGSAPWKGLLVQAVGTPNTLVRLAPTVQMDLSGYQRIFVAGGVTLTGDPQAQPAPGGGVVPSYARAGLAPATRAGAREPGALVFTTTRPRPLFEVWGDNVRFMRFRLQGPHFTPQDGDDNKENGIFIDGRLGVEIADMELSGWSGMAVKIEDFLEGGRQTGTDAVRIHDNVFHHNQHIGGYGYGVDVGPGAWAQITRNVFDFNRHAIAAAGAAGTGYLADQNLVLRGGGVHGKWYNSHTHQFDVHGDRNCPDIPLNRHTWNCGAAGDRFWMRQNTFQYQADDAIKLRGTPRIAAYIYGNVFAHRTVGAAVELRSRTHVLLDAPGFTPSTPGQNTYGRYGACDIDGDGRDDLVLPTGVTWWYSSAGEGRWSFLREGPGRVDDVRLGDVDGDRRCDVLTQGSGGVEMSSGGTAPSRPVPGLQGVTIDQIALADMTGDRAADVFRRDREGQWWVISPGRGTWRPLQSSGFALSELRLGDFNGDGVADVLGPSGGRWSVSWGGRSGWQTLNPKLSGGYETARIVDIDGNRRDDVVRLRFTSAARAVLEWSKDARAPWRTLRTVSFPPAVAGAAPPAFPWIQAGRFDRDPGTELLLADADRMARITDATGIVAQPHNRLPY